jgi:hypothetical protein
MHDGDGDDDDDDDYDDYDDDDDDDEELGGGSKRTAQLRRRRQQHRQKRLDQLVHSFAQQMQGKTATFAANCFASLAKAHQFTGMERQLFGQMYHDLTLHLEMVEASHASGAVRQALVQIIHKQHPGTAVSELRRTLRAGDADRRNGRPFERRLHIHFDGKGRKACEGCRVHFPAVLRRS